MPIPIRGMGPTATLTLFPPHSLDTSILAAVLIGVLLLAALTETFGWVFVGLVVPGYLASIFVINPEAAITVAAEALLTYALSRLLSKGVAATGAWSEFFGRERFFLIVICSVLVRAVSEVVLLPRIAAYIDARYGTTFTIDRSLHSIGLVLVPLTANALWKLGLRRGTFQVAVPVLLTYVALKFVLLPYTNLSFTSLELTYEDVAQRFLASPKAYIILLTTALLAARYNLRYGWDFNGILVAALVALTWLGPLKTASTVAEVLVLVLATRAVLALPGVRTFNLEGPRKTVLVFVLGFLVKCAIGWALGGRVPGLKVTDLFGFGYLVPTLLAVKILQKQLTARVLLPTLHTSLAGVVVGSLIGFPLSLMEPQEAVASPPEKLPVLSTGMDRTPLGLMALGRATCRESDTGEERLRRRRWELRGWEAMWMRLDAWLRTRNDDELARAQETAERLGLLLSKLPDVDGREAWSLKERASPPVGWGVALLFPGGDGPVLDVPHPLSEPPSAEAAPALCARVSCSAVIVSGVDTVWANVSRGDALRDDATALWRAKDALVTRTHLLVRADPKLPARTAALFVPPRAGAALAQVWPGAATDAQPPQDAAEFAQDGTVAVLRAHPGALAQLVTGALPSEPGEVPMADVVAKLSARPPEVPSPLVELPTAELTVLETQVASPLLTQADNPEAIRWARAMSDLLGLEIRQVDGCGDGCWWVAEPSGARPRVGAQLLVRRTGEPLAIEVPAPSREPGTLPFGLELFRTATARALLFTDPSVDPPYWSPHAASPGVVQTSFHALHQAAQRALPEDALVLQLRGLNGRPGLGKDVLVALDRPVAEAAQRPARLEALWHQGGPLSYLSGRVRYHDGTEDVAGLLASTPQQSYSRTFGGAPLATLWLSEQLRGAFLPARDLDEKLAITRLAPFPLEPLRPERALLDGAAHTPSGAASPKLVQAFEALSSAARGFVEAQSVQHLAALRALPSDRAVQVTVRVLQSPDAGLPYLLVEARDRANVMRGVWFLNETGESDPVRVVGDSAESQLQLRKALAQRRPVVFGAEVRP